MQSSSLIAEKYMGMLVGSAKVYSKNTEYDYTYSDISTMSDDDIVKIQPKELADDSWILYYKRLYSISEKERLLQKISILTFINLEIEHMRNTIINGDNTDMKFINYILSVLKNRLSVNLIKDSLNESRLKKYLELIEEMEKNEKDIITTMEEYTDG